MAQKQIIFFANSEEEMKQLLVLSGMLLKAETVTNHNVNVVKNKSSILECIFNLI